MAAENYNFILSQSSITVEGQNKINGMQDIKMLSPTDPVWADKLNYF